MFKELAASQRLDDLQRVASGTFTAGLLHTPSSEGSKLDLQDSDPFADICQETLRTQGSTSQLKPSMEDTAVLSLLHPAKHQFSEVSAIPLKLSQSGFCDTPELSQSPATVDPYLQIGYSDINHKEILESRNSVYSFEWKTTTSEKCGLTKVLSKESWIKEDKVIIWPSIQIIKK